MSIGIQGHIGIGKETVWGTAVAASSYLEAFSESLVTNIERFDIINITGFMRDPDDKTGITRHVGDIVFPAHPENLGHLLNGCLGVNSITTVLSGFLHTNDFTPSQSVTGSLSPLPAYTFEIFRPTAGVDASSSFQYAGGQVSGITMAIAPNQDMRVTASVVAKTRAGITKTTPSFPGSPAGFLGFDVASLAIDDAAVTRYEALTISIQNQLEGIAALNASSEIAKIRRTGPPQVRLNGTLEFQDFTEFDRFINQSEHRFTLNLFNAASHNLLIDVPRAVFSTFPVNIPGRERLTVDFEAIGRYHTGSGNAIKVSLTSVNTF